MTDGWKHARTRSATQAHGPLATASHRCLTQAKRFAPRAHRQTPVDLEGVVP